MVSGNSRRIVVIKDIPSNTIEEAILILKGDGSIKEDKNVREPAGKKKNNDYLVKEAEFIINNYIKESRLQAGISRETAAKPLSFKNKVFTNTVINFALICSIVILIFLISRMF